MFRNAATKLLPQALSRLSGSTSSTLRTMQTPKRFECTTSGLNETKKEPSAYPKEIEEKLHDARSLLYTLANRHGALFSTTLMERIRPHAEEHAKHRLHQELIKEAEKSNRLHLSTTRYYEKKISDLTNEIHHTQLQLNSRKTELAHLQEKNPNSRFVEFTRRSIKELEALLLDSEKRLPDLQELLKLSKEKAATDQQEFRDIENDLQLTTSARTETKRAMR